MDARGWKSEVRPYAFHILPLAWRSDFDIFRYSVIKDLIAQEIEKYRYF